MKAPIVMDDLTLAVTSESLHRYDATQIQQALRALFAVPQYRNMIERMVREGRTAVGRGVCPFPLRCGAYESCDLPDCCADTLDSHGWPWRGNE